MKPSLRLVVSLAVLLTALLVVSPRFMGCHGSKLAEARANNAAAGSLAGHRAVVFGGTSGIGQGLAVRLAEGGAGVTIVGRNEKAAEGIIATLREKAPDAQHAFVRGDLMVMSQAREAAKAIVEANPRLDYVVYCQTKATMQGRTPTAEGIDEKLSLNYYSRVYLTRLLTPFLEETARQHDADVRVLSVLSAGVHAPYAKYAEDPYLEKEYSLKNAADAAGFYTDLWIEQAAKEHPNVTFAHAAPGFVDTNWGTDLPTGMRLAVRAMQATPFSKTAADCAEFLVQGLIASRYRGGHRLLDQYGDEAKPTTLHTPEAVANVNASTHAVLDPLFQPLK